MSDDIREKYRTVRKEAFELIEDFCDELGSSYDYVRREHGLQMAGLWIQAKDWLRDARSNY